MDQRILIVEDDGSIRETLADLIETLGYRYSTAIDGVEGLTMVKNHRPSLIISDIMMPRMDGIEMLKLIKADPNLCTIPVILLTAKVELESRLQGFENGADAYVTKPFNLTELSYQINNLLTLKENLIREIIEVDKETDPEWGFILKLHEVLEKYIDSATLDKIADALEMSKSGLQKKLKKYTSAPFQDYVRGFKLSKARSLLKSGKANVSEAAYKSGFRSISHFTRSFKEEFGYPPSKLIA
ncbi:MAG: response regulator [Cyclobacteriaceae bacterium]